MEETGGTSFNFGTMYGYTNKLKKHSAEANNIWLEVMEMDMIGALSTLCERLVLKPKVRRFFPSKVEF